MFECQWIVTFSIQLCSSPGRLLQVFNSCVSKIVVWVLWVSPVGVASLIAAAMIRACDLLQTVIALGMWVCTVLVGLAIFGALLLPFLLWILTRHNPWMFLRKFSRALVLAFGTSSSSAALPVRPPILPLNSETAVAYLSGAEPV